MENYKVRLRFANGSWREYEVAAVNERRAVQRALERLDRDPTKPKWNVKLWYVEIDRLT